MSEIFFIRHGQASFGEADYDRLSAIGVRQSEIAADHLNQLGIHFDALFCGRMKRQIDTAKPFLDLCRARQGSAATLEILPAFDEYDSTALIEARARQQLASNAASAESLEAIRRDRKAFQAYFSETVYDWAAGGFIDAPGVESWAAFCKRVDNGVRQITGGYGRGKRLAVFTSGGPISAVLKSALLLSDQMAVSASWQVMNASITSFKYNSEALMLWGFNNTTHLMLQKDPALLTHR